MPSATSPFALPGIKISINCPMNFKYKKYSNIRIYRSIKVLATPRYNLLVKTVLESQMNEELMKKSLVVGVGGIVGSLARWGLSLLIVDHGFPWATLFVNLTGSAILLFILEWSELHPYEKWWWRPLFATGFCGGYTTFSAFAVKLVQYIQDGKYLTFVLYAAASLAGTFLLLWLMNATVIRSKALQIAIMKRHGEVKTENQSNTQDKPGSK